MEKNLVELHIYLQSNSIQYVREEPDYEFSQLLSDLGGVIGLYLGMAVVSALELLESSLSPTQNINFFN